MHVLRKATKATMELHGFQSSKHFHQSSDELKSTFSRQTLTGFLNLGRNMKYSHKTPVKNVGKSGLGPYNIKALLKCLHSTLTQDNYDASPVVAGLMLCLTQRVRLGDYLPINSDYQLRPAAIGVVEVEGGGKEDCLVYHPQSTDAEYEVENGRGYSAVQLDTILVARVYSLHDINGEDIDVAIDDSDDFVVAQYGGIQEREDGSDSIVLSVIYNKKGAKKVETGTENVYLSANEGEVWRDVVAKNLFVVASPGSLPTFYEDSDQLEPLIKLRDSLEGTTGTSEVGNDSDAESFDAMEVEQVVHV